VSFSFLSLSLSLSFFLPLPPPPLSSCPLFPFLFFPFPSPPLPAPSLPVDGGKKWCPCLVFLPKGEREKREKGVRDYRGGTKRREATPRWRTRSRAS